MTKPKLKEHLYRDMVNELRVLVFNSYLMDSLKEKYEYGRVRTDIVKIVSKYIEAGE